jgi:hypothetical protein
MLLGCARWRANSDASLLVGDALGDRAAHGSANAPNPEKAPAWMLGPIDVLIYVDPWFAGTIVFWLLPGAVILAGLMLWTTGMLGLRKGRANSPACPPVFRILLISSIVGLFLALPWLYAITRLFSQNPFAQ